jgi:hypothetical protein
MLQVSPGKLIAVDVNTGENCTNKITTELSKYEI